MTTIYKLTTAIGSTYGGTHWTPGVWLEVEWGGALCRPGCLHAYSDPLLAVLMDPAHSVLLPGGKLWVAEGNVLIDDNTKLGCDRMRIIREHEVPEVSVAQRIRWAIYCARCAQQVPEWLRWADEWLDGSDRSANAAHNAATAATAANAANAAYHAANAATYATYYNAAIDAANAAAYAANAATYAAANAAVLYLAVGAIAEEP